MRGSRRRRPRWHPSQDQDSTVPWRPFRAPLQAKRLQPRRPWSRPHQASSVCYSFRSAAASEAAPAVPIFPFHRRCSVCSERFFNRAVASDVAPATPTPHSSRLSVVRQHELSSRLDAIAQAASPTKFLRRSSVCKRHPRSASANATVPDSPISFCPRSRCVSVTFASRAAPMACAPPSSMLLLRRVSDARAGACISNGTSELGSGVAKICVTCVKRP